MCMAAGNNFGSLAALRILLGAFEAAVNPGFTIITSTWYKPSEHALRHGLWYGGASLAYIFGGILAYAISHIQSAIKSWQACKPLSGDSQMLIQFVANSSCPVPVYHLRSCYASNRVACSLALA
jgi:MFS family permease